jgi:DNA-binding NarL/FixJ family response regulator
MARILVFTIHDNAILAERAMQSGARGYVTKSCGREVLIRAVRQVARDQDYLSPAIAEKVALRAVRKEESPMRVLTRRELEVFRLIAEGRSAAEVAETLHLSVKTVTNNLTRIKRKLRVSSAAELVYVAIRSATVDPLPEAAPARRS